MGNKTAFSSGSTWPWLMLVIRTMLFGFWQMIFAGVMLATGIPSPWARAAGWWPLSATLGSLVVLALLVWLYKREGLSFWSLFRFRSDTVKQDLLAFLGIVAISAPIALLPNVMTARWLFGDAEVALDLLIRPLPLWATVLSLLAFPISVALSEAPNYYAYVMPRIERQTKRTWLAVLLPSLWLAAQHITLPFVADIRFIAWRFLMFLPFALLLGTVLRWRPRLLPYLVVFHGLLDLSTAFLVFYSSL